jgi:hypothetical protein
MKFSEIVQHLIDGGAARRGTWKDNIEIRLSRDAGFEVGGMGRYHLRTPSIKADDWEVIPEYMTWGEASKAISNGKIVGLYGHDTLHLADCGRLTVWGTNQAPVIRKDSLDSDKWFVVDPNKISPLHGVR